MTSEEVSSGIQSRNLSQNGDEPGICLVTRVFDGTGLSSWKRAMLIALNAKKRRGFVDGSNPKPDEISPDFADWDSNNDMVISWLLNALDKDISDSVIYYQTAQEIWNELERRYGQSSCGVELFQIQKEFSQVSQENDSISAYFTRVNKLWDKMISLCNLPDCNCGKATAFQKHEDDMKLIQLLMGLNSAYTTVRGNILMRKPLPSIGEAYSILLEEERHTEFVTTDSEKLDMFNKFIAFMENQKTTSRKENVPSEEKQKTILVPCSKKKQEMETSKILMRSLSLIDETRVLDGGEGIGTIETTFWREEFHLLNLKDDKVDHHVLPTLLLFPNTTGKMVKLGQSLYLTGPCSGIALEKQYPAFDILSSKPKLETHREFYLGASKLDLDADEENRVWVPTVVPEMGVRVCLLGKIYNFRCLEPVPEVFDPLADGGRGEWKPLGPLPHEISGCGISSKLILSDPLNSRILMRLSGGNLPAPCLYAFYPDKNDNGGTWSLVMSNLIYSDWGIAGAVLDRVIYIHRPDYPQILRAYDVELGRWLNVKWSPGVINDTVITDEFKYEFKTLVCMGNTTFCLCTYGRDFPRGGPPSPARTVFLRFRVVRVDDSNVTLVPLSSHKHELPSTHAVRDYIPI